MGAFLGHQGRHRATAACGAAEDGGWPEALALAVPLRALREPRAGSSCGSWIEMTTANDLPSPSPAGRSTRPTHSRRPRLGDRRGTEALGKRTPDPGGREWRASWLHGLVALHVADWCLAVVLIASSAWICAPNSRQFAVCKNSRPGELHVPRSTERRHVLLGTGEVYLDCILHDLRRPG